VPLARPSTASCRHGRMPLISALEVFSRNALYKFTFYITLHYITWLASDCTLQPSAAWLLSRHLNGPVSGRSLGIIIYTPCFRKKTPTHIIGYKLRSSCLIFTALHGMQTQSCAENSIRPSVRPSVRHCRRVHCDKTAERYV